MLRIGLSCILAVFAGAALAQSQTPGGLPPPPGMSLAQSNAMRFPQPVRAGDLIGRAVIEPVESQDLIGRVRSLVRAKDGTIVVVVAFSNFLGLETRLVGIAKDAMVLSGPDLEVDAYTPRDMADFPTFDPAGSTPLPPETKIAIGLAKPSH